MKAGAAAQLERSTLKTYAEHCRLHIISIIGAMRLAELNAPMVRAFQDALREKGRSSVTIRRVIASLGSILTDAQERGEVGHNAVRELSRNRKRGKERQDERRRKGKLTVGVDIPAPAEVESMIANARARWRPFLIAAFAGLRASELRGLRWSDVELDAGRLHVSQRTDRFNEIGFPKSEAGHRTRALWCIGSQYAA